MLGSSSSEGRHIVVVDDDRTCRGIVSALLSRQPHISVSEVESGDDLEKLLFEKNVDCILLDYNLGTENGFGVRDRLARQFGRLPPIVMMTSDERQSTAIKALRVGVDDFLPKRGLSTATLLSSIAAAGMRHAAASLLETEVRRLSEASVRDHVTGLATRATLEGRLARLHSTTSKFVLLAVNVAQIRFVEATFGPVVADKALKRFANRIKDTMRSTDLCAFWEADIFVVVVEPLLSGESLDCLSSRLQEALSFRLDLPEVSVDLKPSVRIIADVEGLRSGRPKTDSASSTLHRTSSDVGMADVAQDGALPARSDNRRREPRQRVFKKGQIVIAGAAAIIDCTIRNISENGAGIRLGTAAAPPVRFDLKIAGADRTRLATVRWQNGCDLGVEFLG